MNERTGRRGRGGLIVLLVIILLLALICAAPFIYNALSHFEYDDYAALAAANAEPVDFSVDDDGDHLLLRADKADVYALLLETGALDRLQDSLAGRATLERLGYSLTPERASVCMAVRLLGLIPVQLQANADISLSEKAVSFRFSDVQVGPWIRIGAEKIAELAGAPELSETMEASLTEYTEPMRVDRIWIENDGLAMSSALLGEVLDEVAAQQPPYARILWLYYDDEAPAAARALVGVDRAAFIRSGCESIESMRGALREVTAFGTDDYRDALRADLEDLPFDICSELDAAAALRSDALELIAQAQDRYAEAQLALRKLYWYKEVTLTAARLLDESGAPLEDRLPAEWGARVVLQYNADYDAIVKTNEGNPRLQVPIPGLPLMSELKRDSRASLPAEGDGPFDLTIALRLPSGKCALVFLTAEDEYGLCLIPEETYLELYEAERLPVRSSGELIAPRSEWLRLTRLRSEEMTPGNYIRIND